MWPVLASPRGLRVPDVARVVGASWASEVHLSGSLSGPVGLYQVRSQDPAWHRGYFSRLTPMQGLQGFRKEAARWQEGFTEREPHFLSLSISRRWFMYIFWQMYSVTSVTAQHNNN